jgi:hypothetical protein
VVRERRRVRRAVAAMVVVAALTALRPAVAGEDLALTVSDAEFWQLITDVSEPNGYFRFENFVSNESTIQSVVPALKMRPAAGGAYVGVGPEQNFTYIAALHPAIAFIIDIRRQNLLEHLMYKALFELSTDRADFVSRLFSRKRPTGLGRDSRADDLFQRYVAATPADEQLFDSNLRGIIDTLTHRHNLPLSGDDLSVIRYVYGTFFHAGPELDYSVGSAPSVNMPTYVDLMTEKDGNGEYQSYLASEENFQVVKQLEAGNLVIPVVGDFAGHTAVRGVGRYLAARHVAVAAFYVSNVERYLFEESNAWRRFYVNVAILPYDEQSVFIRSVLNPPGFGSRTLLCPIADVMNAFGRGSIGTYEDVLTMSN